MVRPTATRSSSLVNPANLPRSELLDRRVGRLSPLEEKSRVGGAQDLRAILEEAGGAMANLGMRQASVGRRSQGFAGNLALAKQVLVYVDGLSRVATSRPSHIMTSWSMNEDGLYKDYTFHPDQAARRAQIKGMRDRCATAVTRRLAAIDPRGDMLTDYERHVQLWRQCNAELLEMSKTIGPDELVANCLEKAMLGFDMIARRDDNPQIDVVALKTSDPFVTVVAITGERKLLPRGPDHAFLVIGRDPASVIGDASTWGEHAVICDPWAGRVYSPMSLKEEMALISSTTGGATECVLKISLPESTAYDPDPKTLFLTAHGAGDG